MHNLGRFETVGRSSDEFGSIEGVSLIKLDMIKKVKKMKGHQGALTPVASCMANPPFQVRNANRCLLSNT